MFFPQIEGLKFPDEFITKYFFKNQLHKKTGSVLEIGSSNGNNLLLFYQYGWNVTGVDISEEALRQAQTNFNACKKANNLTNTASFILQDMVDFATTYNGESFDIILLPGSFYYTNIFNINKILEGLSKRQILKNGGEIFIRYRDPEDYRFGKGEKMGPSTFKFDFDVTGEEDCINTFFTQEEMKNLLGQFFSLSQIVELKTRFENIQQNQIINNADNIIWANAKII